jgi:hypothetical protein
MQKLTRTLTMAGALAFAGVLAGCGDDVTVAPNPTINLTPPAATVNVGQSVQFSAAVSGITNATVTWTSSDQTKATVDATGKATAVAVGITTITASAGTGTTAVSASAVLTIASRGVTNVEVAPNNAILKAGDFLQATANVTADPGVARTVTWSSSATGVATVDNTGKITAVANGTATITAASTVDPSVVGTLALTVRPIQLAQISIQAVTKGGTTQPVNFNNVTGQIDVVLNVDPGEERVTKVDVNFDGVSACTRNLSASESDALRIAAAFEEVAAVDIVCSINTADFATATGAVKFLNGSHVLSASGTVAGPPARTITATDQAIVLQNQSGFIAEITNTNTNTGSPNSAINPTTGQNWVQGSTVLKLTAVNYTAGGATVSGVSGSFLTGGTQTVPASHIFTQVAPAAGTQVFTITYPNSGTSALNTVAYQSPGAGEFPVVTGSVLSTGQTGPTTILNSPANAPNLGLTAIEPTRLDNVAPVVPTVGSMPIWLNGAFNFDTTSTAVTVVSDAGVDNVTYEVYFIAGALPTASACDLTGMTKVTSASALDETTVSSAYRARAVIKDALGNQRCADLAPGGVAGGQFGADRTAPADPDFDAPANDTTFITTGAADAATFAFSNLQDNASGFGTYPVLATLRRFNAAGTTSCLIGTTGTTCATKGDTAASFSVTRNTGVEGYYLFSGQVQDSALNANATVFSRRLLVDATPAAVVGILSMPNFIAGQSSPVFNGQVTDNIDLAQYYGLTTYGGAPFAIRSAATALGTYGQDALTKTSNVSLTLVGAMRCLAQAPGGVIGAQSKLATIDLRVQDFAQMNDDVSSGITGGAQTIPAAAVEDCGSITTINNWADSLPAAAVNISKAGTTASTPTTVNLMARANVPLNVTANPFQRVEFYRVSGAELIKIGNATMNPAVQTPTERFYTYTMTWDPPATLADGAVTIVAIGVTSSGDGAQTAGNANITIVP